jgi:hypothetical protein
MRWSLEVTFEEAREHLGMEPQRQWSDLAIARTTPVILGLFSLVVMLARRLQPDGKVPILTTAWYQKTEATFSDCLALARKHLWNSKAYGYWSKFDFAFLTVDSWRRLEERILQVNLILPESDQWIYLRKPEGVRNHDYIIGAKLSSTSNLTVICRSCWCTCITLRNRGLK